MKENLVKSINEVIKLSSSINLFISMNNFQVVVNNRTLEPQVYEKVKAKMFFIKGRDILTRILDSDDQLLKEFTQLEKGINFFNKKEVDLGIAILKHVRENIENDVYTIEMKQIKKSSSRLSDSDKKEVKKIISQNKIEDAFDRLREIFDGHAKENDLIQLIRRYNKNKKNLHNDLLSNDNLQMEENKIVNALLEFIK